MKNIHIPTKIALAIILLVASSLAWFLCIEYPKKPYMLEILAANHPEMPLLGFMVQQSIPDSQPFAPIHYKNNTCSTENLSAISFELKKIIYTVKPDDNLWNVLAFSLKQQELVSPLSSNELQIALDKVKDEIRKMSSDELKNIGISSGDASKLSPGDKISLSPVILNIRKVYDFTEINLLNSETYKKNDAYVCWNGIQIKGADPKTFVAFSDYQGMDDYSVYFSNKAVTDADVNSFAFLNMNYSVDNKSVYYFRKRIEGADPQSFQVLDNGHAKDKNYIYLLDERLGKADPNNKIYSMGTLHLRSGDSIYRGKDLIVGANADTFIPYTDENGYTTRFSRDNRHAFYEASVIPDADMNSFQIFEGSIYSKDKNNVYCKNQIMTGVDMPTFRTYKLNGALFAKDINNNYNNCVTQPTKK